MHRPQLRRLLCSLALLAVTALPASAQPFTEVERFVVIQPTESYAEAGDVLWIAQPGERYTVIRRDGGWLLAYWNEATPDEATWFARDERIVVSRSFSDATPSLPVTIDAPIPPALPTGAPALTMPVPTVVPTVAPTSPPSALPLPADTLRVTAVGGGTGTGGSRIVGYAFLAENTSATVALGNVQYQAALYDATGAVLATDSSTLRFLFPGERTGVANTMVIPEGARLDRIEVQARARESEPLSTAVQFPAERISYRPDRFFPKVTGVISNPYAQTVSQLRVSAVAYNAAGAIIGGGFTYLDFVPAGSSAAVEVSTHSSGVPARVELYAHLTALSVTPR